MHKASTPSPTLTFCLIKIQQSNGHLGDYESKCLSLKLEMQQSLLGPPGSSQQTSNQQEDHGCRSHALLRQTFCCDLVSEPKLPWPRQGRGGQGSESAERGPTGHRLLCEEHRAHLSGLGSSQRQGAHSLPGSPSCCDTAVTHAFLTLSWQPCTWRAQLFLPEVLSRLSTPCSPSCSQRTRLLYPSHSTPSSVPGPLLVWRHRHQSEGSCSVGVMGCSDDRRESQKEPGHGQAHSAAVKVVSPHTLDCELRGAECTIPSLHPSAQH